MELKYLENSLNIGTITLAHVVPQMTQQVAGNYANEFEKLKTEISLSDADVV